ncbi:MAG: hypothetical protein ABIO76_02495 [Ginsengibacter sp.]
MKHFFWIAYFCFLFISCKKESHSLTADTPDPVTEIPLNLIKYTIHKGQQYCDQNTYKPIVFSGLKFSVKFDSSAIYSAENPGNQTDINKLYGFSDNNTDHHQFSARFGWRWSDNALRLFAYIYNDSKRVSKELGTVIIGSENFCSIAIAAGNYIFSLNNKSDTLTRKSITQKAVGYQLYPYFGGDEVAPHDISIWIKDLP